MAGSYSVLFKPNRKTMEQSAVGARLAGDPSKASISPPPAREKIPEQPPALLAEQPAVNLDSMVQPPIVA
jgi:hypothetical protein